MTALRLYALSILCSRDEPLIGEDEIVPGLLSFHYPIITTAGSAVEAEAIGLRLANEAKPMSEGWRHDVVVMPFVMTAEIVGGEIRLVGMEMASEG